MSGKTTPTSSRSKSRKLLWFEDNAYKPKCEEKPERRSPRPARSRKMSTSYAANFLTGSSSEDSQDEDTNWERKKSLKRSSRKTSKEDSGGPELTKKRKIAGNAVPPVTPSTPIPLNENNGGSVKQETAEEDRNDSTFLIQPVTERNEPDSADCSKLTSLDDVVKREPEEDAYSLPPHDEVCPLSDPEYEPYESPSESDNDPDDPGDRKLNIHVTQKPYFKEDSATTGVSGVGESDQKLFKIKNAVGPLATTAWPDSLFRLPDSLNISLQVSKTCRIGANFDESRLRKLPSYESRPYPTQFTRVVEELMQAARQQEEFIAVLSQVSGSGQQSMPVYYSVNGKLECKNIPVVENLYSAQAWLSDLLEATGCCKKLFVPDFIANEFVCKQCLDWNQERRNDVGLSRGKVASDNRSVATQTPDFRKMTEAERKRKEEEKIEKIEEERRKAAKEEQRKREEERAMAKKMNEEENKRETTAEEMQKRIAEAELKQKMDEEQRKNESSDA